ncbi:hypothetical protein [Halanaeroarchaeum sp. HSR-CO]|uniref:hypothetical protein n=1 Tax=Halanaeroarchaeum sp. HSR-CO TaxID=2866382 RepID=UPI00217E7BB6|nr:hypothetical protein [Halanaeroarchaeum sp. HSR-CO]
MPSDPHPRAAFTDDLVDELADVFVKNRGVDRDVAETYAETVLRRDRKMRKWLVGLRANAVEAVYLNLSLQQYEAYRVHSGEYSPKDQARIREDLTALPSDFVTERGEEWAWLHPRVRWVNEGVDSTIQ